MEMLNVAAARVGWLFDIAELNPRGKTLMPELIAWIAEEYHFEQFPKSINDLDDVKALSFSRGTFQAEEEFFVDIELKIFSDGLVAVSRSNTKHTEAFLLDVVKSAVEEFSLTFRPHMITRKIHTSEVIVYSSKSLDGFNPKIAVLIEKITEHLPENTRFPFEFAGLMAQQLHNSSNIKISPFRFERKNGTMPEECKYYSSAPLHTQEHLELLGWFEQEFMS